MCGTPCLNCTIESFSAFWTCELTLLYCALVDLQSGRKTRKLRSNPFFADRCGAGECAVMGENGTSNRSAGAQSPNRSQSRLRWRWHLLIALTVMLGIAAGLGTFTFGYGKGASYLS